MFSDDSQYCDILCFYHRNYKSNGWNNILIVKYHYDHLKNNRIIQTVITSNEFTNVSDYTSF